MRAVTAPVRERAAPRPVVDAGFTFVAVDLRRHPVRRVHPARWSHVDRCADPGDLRTSTALAELDLARAARRGYPEAIYCEGKTPEQVRAIAGSSRRGSPRTVDLGRGAVHPGRRRTTRPRCSPRSPTPCTTRRRGCSPGRPSPPAPSGGLVAVLCAGTSDLPVAREAAADRRATSAAAPSSSSTSAWRGCTACCAAASCIDRARSSSSWPAWTARWPASSRAWLARRSSRCPPRWAMARRSTAWRRCSSMLNACAPGVGVVNIDNGYGAGHLAAQIAAR